MNQRVAVLNWSAIVCLLSRLCAISWSTSNIRWNNRKKFERNSKIPRLSLYRAFKSQTGWFDIFQTAQIDDDGSYALQTISGYVMHLLNRYHHPYCVDVIKNIIAKTHRSARKWLRSVQYIVEVVEEWFGQTHGPSGFESDRAPTPPISLNKSLRSRCRGFESKNG